ASVYATMRLAYGCSSMVEFQHSKLAMRVQSPPPAPISKKTQRSGAATEVAQTSKSAVSRVSKPAKRSNAPPIGKSATRQVWKPATVRRCLAAKFAQPAKVL